MAAPGLPAEVRLAELAGALASATDASAGLPPESATRTALVAVHLARAAGAEAADVHAAWWTGLCRFLGCSAYSAEMAALAGGEDQAFLAALTGIDARNPIQALGAVAPFGPGALLGLVTRPSFARDFARSHCALALALAAELELPPPTMDGIGALYERFDGHGQPRGLAGVAIPFAARVTHVAFRAVATGRLLGAAAVPAALAHEAGRELDPELVAVLRQSPEALRYALDAPDVWEAFLAAEPTPHRFGSPLRIARAFARHADVKAPARIGHSEEVAALCRRAAPELGLDPARAELLGLLHDLGVTTIPNGILEKTSPLTPAEERRWQGHVTATAAALAPCAALDGLADAALAHERLDGRGYARGLPGTSLGNAARLLAAADTLLSLRMGSPGRPPVAVVEARSRVEALARDGALCHRATAAVFVADGAPAAEPAIPDGLTRREAEVLVLLARGLGDKQIAARLGISVRTANHHVQHIYEKTGVRGRAALAVHAVALGIGRAIPG